MGDHGFIDRFQVNERGGGGRLQRTQHLDGGGGKNGRDLSLARRRRVCLGRRELAGGQVDIPQADSPELAIFDDGQAAYALAAPTIKDMFSDSDHFLAMVRDHYAPVYRHRSADFGAFKGSGDEASLEATLVDNDNVVWTALYSFRRVGNGNWLISGCVLAKAEASAI